MSTGFNQYLITGVRIPYERGTYEEYEAYDDNGYKKEIGQKNGLTVLYDGMCGKYIVIGVVHQKSPYDQPFEEEVVQLNSATDKTLIRNLIQAEFTMEVLEEQIRTFVVTHWH